jgi:hypothetical protein
MTRRTVVTQKLEKYGRINWDFMRSGRPYTCGDILYTIDGIGSHEELVAIDHFRSVNERYRPREV